MTYLSLKLVNYQTSLSPTNQSSHNDGIPICCKYFEANYYLVVGV